MVEEDATDLDGILTTPLAPPNDEPHRTKTALERLHLGSHPSTVMPAKTLAIVQPFETGGKKLVAERAMEFTNAVETVAQANPDAPRMAGAAALTQMVDVDRGEVMEEPVVLAQQCETGASSRRNKPQPYTSISTPMRSSLAQYWPWIVHGRRRQCLAISCRLSGALTWKRRGPRSSQVPGLTLRCAIRV